MSELACQGVAAAAGKQSRARQALCRRDGAKLRRWTAQQRDRVAGECGKAQKADRQKVVICARNWGTEAIWRERVRVRREGGRDGR